MNEPHRSRVDELLDVLAEAVAERLEARRQIQHDQPEPALDDAPATPTVVLVPDRDLESLVEPEPESGDELDAVVDYKPGTYSEADIDPVPVVPPSYAATLMARLAVGVCVLLVLINIPFTSQGTALARSIPSSASLVIRNGLIIKETNSPEIWIYRDGAFHWITSMEVFEQLGYDWQDVHVVNAGFLKPFVEGRPVYLVYMCLDSPHYYRYEDGRKRWLVDVPTFLAEGYTWQDLTEVSCDYLRQIPDGDTIPPGRGSPPAPLP